VNPPYRFVIVAVVALAAAALALVLLSALRIYRFESAFYRPPRHTPARPLDLPELRDASITAGGGDRLAAWYHPPRAAPGAVVVLAHASLGDRAQLVPQARWLVDAGYGVLLFDWPGHGASEGRVTYGRGELDALRAVVDWLVARPEIDGRRVGGLGCSLGGYLLLAGAGEDARLRAVVAEAAPTDLVAAARWQYRRRAPLGPWAALLAARRAGADLGATSALMAVTRVEAPRALLLIAGQEDDVVPPSMAATLRDAAGDAGELWRVPGAGHCQAHEVAPDEYQRRVRVFFERALGPG
jgi:hypothetical protein